MLRDSLSDLEKSSTILLKELRSTITNDVRAVGSSAIRSLARGLGDVATLGSSHWNAQYSNALSRRKPESIPSSQPLQISSSIQVKPGLPSIADLLDAACDARDASLRNCSASSGPIERVENAQVRVGAALLARSGKIHVGSMIDVFGTGLVSSENGFANGSLSAETVALIKAISDGDTSFEALIIACDSDDVHVFPTTASSKTLASYGDFDVYAARADRLLIKRKINDLAGVSMNEELERAKGSNTVSDPVALSLETHDTIFAEIPVLSWSVGHVLAWVDKCLGLPQYQHLFRDCSVDGFLLLSLSSADLKLLLRIEHPLHRRKAEQGIQRLIERRDREKNTHADFLSKPSSIEMPLKTTSKINVNDGKSALKSDVSSKTVQFSETKLSGGASKAGKNPSSATSSSHFRGSVQASVTQKSNAVNITDTSIDKSSVAKNNIASEEKKIEQNHSKPSSMKSLVTSEQTVSTPIITDHNASFVAQKDSTITQVDAVPIIEMAANLHDDTRRLLHPQQVLRLYHVFQDAFVSANCEEGQHGGPLQPLVCNDSSRFIGRQINSIGGLDSSQFIENSTDQDSLSFAPSTMRSTSVISPDTIKRDVTYIRLDRNMLISASRRLGYSGSVPEAECTRLVSARGKVKHENIITDSVSFSDFADFVAGVFQHGSAAHSSACAAANRVSAIASAQVQLAQLAQVQAAQANALRLSFGLPAALNSQTIEKRDGANMVTTMKPIPVVDSRGHVLFIHPSANRSFSQESVTLPNLDGSSLLGTSMDVMNASLANASTSLFPAAGTYFPPTVRDGCVVQVSVNMIDGWVGAPGTDPWYTAGLDYNTYAVRVLRKQSSIFEEIVDAAPPTLPMLTSSFVKQDDPTSSAPPSPDKRNFPAASSGAASVSSIRSQDSRHPADFAPDEIKVRAAADESSSSSQPNATVSINSLQSNLNIPKQLVRPKMTLADTREIKSGELLSIGESVIARKGGEKKAYPALITGLRKKRDGSVTYSVDFSNGVEEHDVLSKYIRVIVIPISTEEGIIAPPVLSESKVIDNKDSLMQNEKPGPKFAVGDSVKARVGERKVARITNVRTDRDGFFSYDIINLGIGGVKILSVPERDLEGHTPPSGRVSQIFSEGLVVARGSDDGKAQEGKIESESKL